MAERKRLLRDQPRQTAVVWAVLAIVSCASIVYVASDWLCPASQRRWHVVYFSNVNLTNGSTPGTVAPGLGDSEAKTGGSNRGMWVLSPDFDFGEGSPMVGIPKDHFSARFDTCLTVGRRKTAAFDLASDDGSRLFVDGRQIIDNWGAHGIRYKHAQLDLEPGLHHLRIEYFDGGGGAYLQFLVAGLDRGAPERLDLRFLSRPSIEGDVVRCLPRKEGGLE